MKTRATLYLSLLHMYVVCVCRKKERKNEKKKEKGQACIISFLVIFSVTLSCKGNIQIRITLTLTDLVTTYNHNGNL